MFLCLFSNGQKDGDVLDGVVAVIGEELLLKSTLETRYSQMISQGMVVGPNAKCQLLEELLFSKLLLAQSKIDSVQIGDQQVEAEINRRLRSSFHNLVRKTALKSFTTRAYWKSKKNFAPTFANRWSFSKCRLL